MPNEIIRLLRIICKLLDGITPDDSAPRPNLGGCYETVNFKVMVKFSPNYKQFAKWDANFALRNKYARQRLSREIERFIESEVLIGYVVRVDVEQKF